MATYTGVILTDALSLSLEKKVFNDAQKLTVTNEHANLEQKVFESEKINLFLLGDTNEIATKKIRVFKGHTTWGEGSVPPRRYPLENPWRRNSQ